MQNTPPSASRLSNLFATLAEASTHLPAPRAWTLAITALVAVTALDAATGTEINLVLLYLIIACFASWCLGEKVGFAFGMLSVLLAGLVNGFGSAFPAQDSHLHHVAVAWNTLARFGAMAMLVALASGLRCALDQARWRAATDGLTGALNKGAFTRRLDMLVTQAQRRGDSLVLAYIDLDGFKGVNDAFGHAAGDTLLRDFSEAAVDAIRAGDLFARIGGDEFVALLTVDTCDNGDIAAERLHQRLSGILRETGHDVTCSIGALVLHSRQVAEPARLVETADGLMYEVKRSGKNALRIARMDLQFPRPQESPLPLPDRRQTRLPVRNAA